MVKPLLLFVVIMLLALTSVSAQSMGAEAAGADASLHPRLPQAVARHLGSPTPATVAADPVQILQSLFWEYVLLIFGSTFLVWLLFLILGLTAGNGTFAAVMLAIASLTSGIGIPAFLVAVFAFIMIVTREQRRVKRRAFFKRFW